MRSSYVLDPERPLERGVIAPVDRRGRPSFEREARSEPSGPSV